MQEPYSATRSSRCRLARGEAGLGPGRNFQIESTQGELARYALRDACASAVEKPMRQALLERLPDSGILLVNTCTGMLFASMTGTESTRWLKGSKESIKDKASWMRRPVDRARKHKHSLQHAPTRGRAMPLQALWVIAMHPKFAAVA